MSSSPFFEEFLLYNYSKHNQVDFGTMTNIGFKCFWLILLETSHVRDLHPHSSCEGSEHM